MQNEKCHLLIENETQRLKSLDEQHGQQLRDWKDQLKPRKKVGRHLNGDQGRGSLGTSPYDTQHHGD